MSNEELKESQSVNDSTVVNDNEMGDIRIHESVIASLARRAALAIPGVLRLAGNSLMDNIAEIVGSRKMQARNINIVLGNDSDVAIEMKVVMKFGFRIPEVASAIQKAVIDAVEGTTGMRVTSVHVLIQNIEDETVESDESDENS